MLSKDKFLILKMTYGGADRLTENIGITNDVTKSIQHMFNIDTGDIIEERLLTKYNHNGEINLNYDIKSSPYKLLYTMPQPRIGNNTFRIYNSKADLIYTLETTASSLLTIIEYQIGSNLVLIRLMRTSTSYDIGIIYNNKTQQIEEIYNQIFNFIVDYVTKRLIITIKANKKSKQDRKQIQFKIVEKWQYNNR